MNTHRQSSVVRSNRSQHRNNPARRGPTRHTCYQGHLRYHRQPKVTPPPPPLPPLADTLRSLRVEILPHAEVARMKTEYHEKIRKQKCRHGFREMLPEFIIFFAALEVLATLVMLGISSPQMTHFLQWIGASQVPFNIGWVSLLAFLCAIALTVKERKHALDEKIRSFSSAGWSVDPLFARGGVPIEAREIAENVNRRLPGTTSWVHWFYADPFLELRYKNESFFVYHWDESST